MQLVGIFFLVSIFLLTVWLMGCFFWNTNGKKTDDALFLGFFIYYSVFEVFAFPLIMKLKPLSYLTCIWIFVLICFYLFSIWHFLLKRGYKNVNISIKQKWMNPFLIIALLLFFVQTSYMLIHSQNGWDAAYYIPNVVQSIDTNTMYIYMNGNGQKAPNIYVRYAISSLYMHDAVLGQFSGIHGAIICRWFNTIVCSLFSTLIVYKIGKLLLREEKKVIFFIIFWILANFGLTTIFFPSAFLIERAYEGKAYCNNIVIPAVIYVFLKIYRYPDEKINWIELFWVNMASVAISSSSLAVVPVLNGALFLGHLISKKRIKDIGKIILCILPSVMYFFIYALYQYGSFKVIIP